jgi:hypothetical protein
MYKSERSQETLNWSITAHQNRLTKIKKREMIFNKYSTCKQFSNERINLEQLIEHIKENPKKSEILKLRQLPYKSSQYDALKLKLSPITPHGTFTGSRKESIENLSGYMYFDIDGFTTKAELNETIKKLNDTFPLTFICKSCGGQGLAFLLKVNGITKDNFKFIHAFIRNEFLKDGYNIDKAAGGLIRKWIVSYDPDVIYNKDAEYNLDMPAYEKFVEKHKTTPKKINKTEPDLVLDLDLDDGLESDIIPFDALCKLITTESKYVKKITGDFTVEEMEYYKIIYPRIIKDGDKHRTYIRIINALYYLNEDITQQQVFSYIFYVNNMADQKMMKTKLLALVKYICGKIEETGEVRLKTRIKKIHFNPESDLTKSNKQSMAAKISGALRSNKTKESIQQVIANFEANSIKVTKKKIAEELGITEKTVQRNWNKAKTEISSLDFTFKKKAIKPVILSEFDYVEESCSDDSGSLDCDDFFDDAWDDLD